MPILADDHDLPHDIDDDPAHSESYYFNAYDPATDAGLFSRIGVRPNEGTIDIGFTAWLPNNRVADLATVAPYSGRIDQLDVGGIRYERLETMRRWRIVGRAACEVIDLADGARTPATLAVDATFQSVAPPIGVDASKRSTRTDGASASTATSVGTGHLEQAGTWDGWIEVDGDRHTLSPSTAYGNRDRSWGPRRWGGPLMWRWFSINFPDFAHVGGIRIATASGDLHRGWIWRDGESTSISDWQVSTELADDGLTHSRSRVVATDKAGRTHELDGTVLRVHGVVQQAGDRTTIVNEGLAAWTYDGHTGHGISEYLHQLDEQRRPLVPIE